ncbi:MAG: STAS domain-containing protein [Verrucomicrobia bacterium]|nr:STAS domain-containing protein [Verrucomicrobiota bacterium]
MSPEVLRLSGEIDLNEKPRVAARLEPLLNRKLPVIVIDLADVSYVDSSGLALFIDALQRAQSYGGQLVLSALRDNVKMVFEIARLDQVFKIYPTGEDAVRALTV